MVRLPILRLAWYRMTLGPVHGSLELLVLIDTMSESGLYHQILRYNIYVLSSYTRPFFATVYLLVYICVPFLIKHRVYAVCKSASERLNSYPWLPPAEPTGLASLNNVSMLI